MKPKIIEKEQKLSSERVPHKRGHNHDQASQKTDAHDQTKGKNNGKPLKVLQKAKDHGFGWWVGDP